MLRCSIKIADQTVNNAFGCGPQLVTARSTDSSERQGLRRCLQWMPLVLRSMSMALSMYQASIPVFVRMLGNLRTLLEKGGSYAEARKFDATLLADSRDRKSTRLNSSHYCASRMPSYACKK